MKKIYFLIASLFITMNAMTQTVNFTFTRGNQTATVTATGIDGVTATITATAPQANATTNDGLWNTGQTMATATDILCTMTNTNNATEEAPIIYTLSISGLKVGTAFAQAKYISKAVNKDGIYQTGKETRHCNFSLTANNESAGSINDLSIMVNSNSGATVSALFESDKLIADTNGDLILTLKIWKGTTNSGCFYGLQSITLLSNPQQAELEALIEEYEAMSFPNGTEIGLYSTTTVTAFNEAIAAAKKITDATQKDIDNLTAAYNAIEFNAPETGKYYRLKNAVNNRYMSANESRVTVIDDGGEVASTIFYLGDNNTLLSFTQGRYLDCQAKNLAEVGTSHSGLFAAAYGTPAANVITYKNNDYWTFGAYDNGVSINRGYNDPDQAGYNWTIEEVTELPVTVSAAGVATFYTPVALTIPTNVECYYINSAINEKGIVQLTPINNVVPAGNGIVIKAGEGTHNFTIGGEATEITDNLLEGTSAATYITPDGTAYVLAAPDNKVGLYVAALTDGAFLNNANKAYFDVTTANAAPSYSFNFDWAGTTGIEGVEAEGAQNGKIYDITGREVKAITAPGIYIANGRKVVK